MEQRETGFKAPQGLFSKARRPWWWLGLALLCWIAAITFDRYQRRNALEHLTRDLQTWVQEQDARVDALAGEELIIRTYLMDKRQMPAAVYASFADRMVRLSGLPFALFYTMHDSLVYWSRGVPEVDAAALAALPADRRLTRLADGWYLPRRQILSDSVTLYALIPVKHEYDTPGAFLQPHFPANPDLPGEVALLRDTTPYPLKLADGRVLGWLDYRASARILPREYLALLLFLLAGIFTALAAHALAARLIVSGYRRLGPLLFLGSLFGLRALSLALDFTGHFRQLPMFHRAMDHPLLSHSIGDLLLNISMLLWIIIFFYRELPIPDFSGLSRVRRWLIAFGNYLAIAFGLLAMIHLFQILVLDSDITFRFDDIFNFNTYSFLSLLAVQLLLIALFLYSYRILLFVNQTGLSRLQRLPPLLLAGILALGAGWLLDMPIPFPFLGGVVFIYLLLFEFYADVRISNLTWTILWMIFFSGLASGFLFHFNNTKVDRKLESYAERLIDPRDPLLEGHLRSLLQRADGAARLPDLMDEVPYVKHHYHWDEPATPEDTLAEVAWAWRFDPDRLVYLLEDGSGNSIALQRALSETRQVYVELLRTTPYKGIPDLDAFRYALKKGSVILQGNLNQNALFHLREQLKAADQRFLFRFRNVRGHILRQGDLELVITYESSGRGEFLSLFSYLFCLLTVTLFLITLLNTLFTFLPDTLNFSLSHRLSLRNRIQFSVISLIVLSFLIIGMITIFYFKNTTQQYHQERLQRKALGVAKDLESQLARVGALDSALLEDLLPEIARVHETDIDIYGPDGRLMQSSEPLVYRHRLSAPLMDGRALAALTWEGKSLFIGESRIGQLDYRTAWVPLPRREEQPGGYLAVPYYTDRTFLQKDISEFISALLNVYVFLLFIAGALAILVANSITYPISVIGEKLKQFKLGKQNEPLEWSSRDELGELIGEYNRMIRKLQESAELLARSEREGAWREMAKQVAHEIKNPLTPMKLSLQHLQQAFTPAREEDRALLKRVSATLIEQIENLSQIASEFSNFAKIPEAFPEDLVVNDLIRSVHHLFGENDSEGMDIGTDIPEESIQVRADKNQLLRVLNNLVKNAIQAIPGGQQGRVTISLRKEGDLAVIRVEDNGRGIPAEMQEKVFMPNFTTKSSGTGLGLAICRNIVDQMQGRIYFQTRPGSGTVFVVELPLA
jgi:two-component system, NtrC family, nitrogen regulation sensor histidine kinase NtrY